MRFEINLFVLPTLFYIIIETVNKNTDTIIQIYYAQSQN